MFRLPHLVCMYDDIGITMGMVWTSSPCLLICLLQGLNVGIVCSRSLTRLQVVGVPSEGSGNDVPAENNESKESVTMVTVNMHQVKRNPHHIFCVLSGGSRGPGPRPLPPGKKSCKNTLVLPFFGDEHIILLQVHFRDEICYQTIWIIFEMEDPILD